MNKVMELVNTLRAEQEVSEMFPSDKWLKEDIKNTNEKIIKELENG